MFYPSGDIVQVGDFIKIDIKYHGVILAVIDDGQYLDECTKDAWSYLKSGLLVNTDFGGLVHYQESDILEENMELKKWTQKKT